MVHHQKSYYNFLGAFGCACWPPYLRPYNWHKMNFWSKNCIFIGYSVGHQRYKCLDVSTGKILVSCHVVFDKSLYLYKFLECVEPNYKNDHVVLLRSLNRSSFSSSFSADMNFQFVALSPMHMVSTSSHQTNLVLFRVILPEILLYLNMKIV